MTQPRLTRIGTLVAALLVLGALVFLQILNSEKDLPSSLWAYAAIALASLIVISTSRKDLSADATCLIATFVFISYVVVRAIASPVPYVARADLYCATGALALYAFTLTGLPDPKVRLAFLLALLAFGVVHVVVGMVQFGLGKNYELLVPSLGQIEPASRATGFFIDPDHLAGLLEMLAVLGLSVTAWSRWPNWLRVLIGYLTAGCYLGLALTGSRGGYISATTSLIVFCILSFLVLRLSGTARLVKFGGISTAAILLSMLAAWFLVRENSILQRQLNSITNVDQGRINLWQAAIEQWKINPTFGTGSGTYLFYGRQFRSPDMQMDPVDVHNDYLHLLCEYGIVGAATFAFFFFAHIRRGIRAFAQLGPERIAAGSTLRSDRLALNIGALCVIAAYVVHSAVDFNLHIPANALPMALVFALLADPGTRAKSRLLPATPLKIFFAGVAAALLLQCIRLLPGEYYAENARAALRDEEPEAASRFAELALTHENQNPYSYFYLGRALVSLGSKDEHAAERPALYTRALQAFQQAFNLAPLDGTYALEVARIYDRLGRFDEAEKMFARARERDPRSEAIAQLYQAHLEMQQNSPNESSHP